MNSGGEIHRQVNDGDEPLKAERRVVGDDGKIYTVRSLHDILAAAAENETAEEAEAFEDIRHLMGDAYRRKD